MWSFEIPSRSHLCWDIDQNQSKLAYPAAVSNHEVNASVAMLAPARTSSFTSAAPLSYQRVPVKGHASSQDGSRSEGQGRRHARPMPTRCSRTPSASSLLGTSARPAGCRCCSLPQSVPPSPRGIGSSGYAAQRAARSTRLIFVRSIGIATLRSPASFRHCLAASADRTRHSPNLLSCHGPASPTKCGSSTHVASSGNNRSSVISAFSPTTDIRLHRNK